ncbi:NACHT domain-containing NTPase [Micromonospora sp. A202]|uniref:NACHT domain-containing protein n=1 Tax=Micromonospora sp. A202 TaxID=2572899 RepID=UPI001151AA52|nr:NACHT domain-containing protein [Micromonospora sp. A202]
MDAAPQLPNTKELVHQIRYALARLRAHNGHHTFEDLCLAFTKIRICRDVVPATGPVSAGGDQGRDFETFRSYISKHLPAAAVGQAPEGPLVFACTLQQEGLERKVKSDVGKAVGGEPFAALHYFCEANLPAAARHKLIAWARDTHNITLEILDGEAIATNLADDDVYSTARQYLGLPEFLRTRASALHDYLTAIVANGQTHQYSPWVGLSATWLPSLADIFEPPTLALLPPGCSPNSVTDDASLHIGRSVEWQQLVDDHRHVLIFGGPGSGKSGLLGAIATDQARQWLDGADVPAPLTLHARSFVTSMPLDAALREGATQQLGTALRQTLPSELFAQGPAEGRSWLVLVDGLDEISDPVSRKMAIDRITALSEVPWLRLVVASRPLPNLDLARIRPIFESAEILPLAADSRDRLVRQWVTQIGSADPEADIETVLTHLQKLGRSGWARTPLVTHMLCGLWAAEPERELPQGRGTLYRAYLNLLQHKAREDHETPAELSRHALALLSEASYAHLTDPSEPALLDVAVVAAGRLGIGPVSHEKMLWQRLVHDALCRTGLVATEGRQLRFAHITLGEFLAADHLAVLLKREDPAGRAQVLRELLYAGFADRSEILAFLGQAVQEAGLSPDPLVAVLLEGKPEDGMHLLWRWEDDGFAPGPRTIAGLVEIVKGWWTESSTRVAAAQTVGHVDTEEATRLLLAVAANANRTDSARPRVLAELRRAGGEVEAAAIWLDRILTASDPKAKEQPEASRVMAGNHSLPGLALLLCNRHLKDDYRVDAALRLDELLHTGAHRDPLGADALFGAVSALGELMQRGQNGVRGLLGRIAHDAALPVAVQRSARAELERPGSAVRFR